MRPRYDEIPEELRGLPNWVVWKKEKRNNKSGEVRETKVPYNAASGKLAQSNNPSTWTTFDKALAALKDGYHGVGFCLSGRHVGVDLDGCRLRDGTYEPWAEAIIRKLDSYTEISPSGQGVRIVVTGELPDGRRQKDFQDREHHGVGLYDAARGRYLTMTGCRINGAGIMERTPELREIHAELFPPKPPKKATAGGKAALSDTDLLARAKAAKDGGKFARLWDGQWEGSYASQSEADLALCMKLAFWTSRDAGRIDALFRCSGLMREKWNRSDYRESTIAAAIERTSETWKAPMAPVLSVDPYIAPPSIGLLNAVPLFQGRIKFGWLRRRGSLIQAGFTDGREAQWDYATDLRVFARSQDILLDATGFLIPSPAVQRVKQTWEPVAQLIRRIADSDATNIQPPLKDEFEQVIRSTWQRAGTPQVAGKEEFFKILRECQSQKRDHAAASPPRCCVWVGGVGESSEQFVWVYQDALVSWLSTPGAKSKHYAWEEVRKALLMLNFNPRELHRSWKSEKVHVRVWKGPLDLLVDDDTAEDSEL